MKTRSGLWILFVAGLAMIGSVAVLQPFPSAEGETATWSQSNLHVTIPYHTLRAGAGQLTVEVIDPEDRVVGRVQQPVEVAAGGGSWQQDLKLTGAMGTDDLVWHRLRYRFTYTGEKDAAAAGVSSLSQILLRPVVHVLGQQSYAQGDPAAVRVVVTDSANRPLAGSVRIQLSGHSSPLFAGKLNRRGTTEAQFRFPSGLVGSYSLRYAVETPIGSAEVTQPVRLEDKLQILLTTEKPIYQPGQTIHLRALALDRATHLAGAQRNLTFELEDSRGNKVFRKATATDRFGLASAEFTLAEEVNLGTYHLRALLPSGPDGELALNVDRYVLPKFKVAIELTGAAKHGYRPGQRVTGTVRANYFFGKPVDGAEITVKGTGMDVAEFEAGSVRGTTDRDGAYRFDFALPAFFAGRATAQGAARVLIEATVKDSAGHAETRGEPITVSQSPLIVTAVPEGGTLVPNLENQVFILTSYADGKPAAAEVTVRADGNPAQTATTDQGGVAVVHIRVGAGNTSITIEAGDREGNRVSSSINLAARTGADQILLRTERAVYGTGDRIGLKIYSTRNRGTVYLDVVKEGQTVLTRDLDIVNGQAELSLAATPNLAGTLDCHAYLFGRDAQPVGDHRLVFVEPPDDLKIETTADAAVYKPGDDARIRFRVTDARGQGVQAALGVQVVDEAVFALAEKQPGFAKVFFYLEQEALKPRYEIHSLDMPAIVQPVPSAQFEQRDRAARALFAATEMVNPDRFETEVGRTAPMAKFAEYAARYRARFVEQAARGLTHAYTRTGGDLTKVTNLRDAWDTALRIEHPPWFARTAYFVHSAGPDRQFGTADDLSAYMEARPGFSGAPTSAAIEVKIEHDRGPFNGLAQIVGSAVTPAGMPVPDETLSARQIATGKTRTAKADRNGQFSLAGLPAGEYEVRVSSSGFTSNSHKFTLDARDRAVVTAVLTVSSGVVVAEAPQRIRVGGNVNFAMARAEMGAGVGGVLGGIIGGVPSAAPPPIPRQFDAGRLMAPMAAKVATGTLPVAAAPRVRSYFPEALYINPEIVTDQNGMAGISIPLADSITTWRMALMASTPRGALGSGTSSLKVFQDFFVDLDLPVTVTQGDRVSIPVAVYNYAPGRGQVSLRLPPEDWFSLVEDVPEKTLAVDAGRVGGSQFTIQANRLGKFKLTLAARMSAGANSGGGRADIVVREIEVVPNGREQTIVFNGRVDSAVEHHVNFPATAIEGASKILVRLYPGPLSQVIEGMDSLLRMPFGCFEQTSSATYPNVLALDYMKRTKKLTPEIHAKAEGFIANGYQRLLTFEVPGGGFSWFGNAPANKILTSYGLMEFSDMSKVHEVDPRLIARTQQWLAGQQQPDGSWRPDASFINEGATNRYNSDVPRITAYIAWSLENTGYQGPAVERARQFLEDHLNAKLDAYTLAVLANFAVDFGKDRAFTGRVMQQLLDARTEKGDQAWWTAGETGVLARGESAGIETTGLAAQALLKWGEASGTAAKALHYIAARKDANGAWGTTQATIMALRAVLLSTEKGAADVRGTLEMSLNGKTLDTLTLTPENNDLLHQFAIGGADAKNGGTVALRFHGQGGLAYQVVGRYFVPWSEKAAGEPLSIRVDYDRTRLAQDEIATATATVRNNQARAANMVMVDLGIPPGFDLLSEDLQEYLEKSAGRKSGRLEKFSLTATQAILYFDSIAAGDTVSLRFRLRAKYPVRARTFASRVYEYYDPEVKAVARPVQLEVRK